MRTHCVNYARMRVFPDLYLPYKNKIYDSILIQENTGLRKPAFWHVLHSHFLEAFKNWVRKQIVRRWTHCEAYSDTSETYKIDIFAKIVGGFQPFTIFSKKLNFRYLNEFSMDFWHWLLHIIFFSFCSKFNISILVFNYFCKAVRGLSCMVFQKYKHPMAGCKRHYKFEKLWKSAIFFSLGPVVWLTLFDVASFQPRKCHTDKSRQSKFSLT